MKFYEKKSTILMAVLLLLCIPVKAQLVGGTTYPINGTQNPPTSFSTVGNAFTYLNASGTSGNGPIILEIASGYSGEGSTAIPALNAYPGMDPSRSITLRPASGQSPTISTSPAANSSVIRFNGARYFTINGSNNGTTSRDLTITTTSTTTTVTLVSLTPTATSSCDLITVQNVNLRGNSTTSIANTYAAIYMGNPTTPGAALLTGNDSNLFQNNLIEAVRHGIYLRGTNTTGQYDTYNRVIGNTIGGTIAPGGSQNTTFFGGVSTVNGIYINSQQTCTIQGNIIRNSVPGYYYARGINVDAVSVAASSGNKDIFINANKISDLVYTSTGGYGNQGIRVQVNNNTAANINITNNFISNISADGDNYTSVWDYGIYAIQLSSTSASVNTNVGVNIYHNSINMYDNGVQKLLTRTNLVAACIAVQTNIGGGVKVANNVMKNTYPASGASNSKVLAYLVQNTTANPFLPSNNGLCKNNCIVVNGSNTTNTYGFMFNANQTTFANWKSNNVDSNSISVDPEFQDQTQLYTLSYSLNNAGFPVGVATDIDGNSRSLTTPDIGASEYTPPAYNAAMVRIFNVASGCNVGSKQIKVTIKNSALNNIAVGDTIAFWYTVNGGAKKWDTAFISSAIAAGDSLQFTFSSPYNFSTAGSYSIYAGLKYSKDSYPKNDSTGPLTITNYNCLTTTPYATDFENGSDGYTGTGGWVLGVPAKANINTAGSGSIAWVAEGLTGQYSNNMTAYLSSPIFDFSTACKPSMSWMMRFNTETNYDAIILEGTTDNVTWTKVTAITPYYNNNSTYGPIQPDKFSGNNTQWTSYTADLSLFANAPLFRFRFNFSTDGSVTTYDGVAIDSILLQFYPTIGTPSVLSGLQNDTGFIKAPYTFTSSVRPQPGLKYYWYNDGTLIDSTSSSTSATFNTTGSHVLKNILKSCHETDTVTVPVIIVTPVGLPTIDFLADKYSAGVGETIKITSLTGNGVFNWTWMVTPDIGFNYLSSNYEATYTYAAPSSQTTPNTELYFFLGDKFDVCLIAENVNGIDTLCKPKYLDVYNAFNGCTYPTIPFPTGKVFDSGLKGGTYSNNEVCTAMIQPPCADSIFLKLNMLATEANADYLRIYDGDNLTGKPLWDINKYPNGLSGSLASIVNLPSTLVSTAGYVTILFSSNGSNVDQGYEIEYWSTAATSAPSASFTAVDTLCPNADIQFKNTSVAHGNTVYYWDVDNDGIDDYTDADINIQYPTPGVYTVSLRAENCIGVSTFTKNIVIQNPTAKPKTAFSADFTNPATGDIVTMFNQTPGCMESFVWVVSPNTFSYVKGTSATSLNPMITFNAPGCYDVTLITANAVGYDTLKRICYINVKNVCTPFVSQLNGDIGISRVKLNTIDNGSAAGTQAYSNYTNLYGTTLKKGVVYELTMERTTAINSMTRKAWIDYNYDGVFDASEAIAFEAPANTTKYVASFKVPRTINTGYTRLRVGAAFSTAVPNPCGANFIGEFEDYRVIIANDDEKPVITRLGANPMNVERGRPYIEPGATAIDNADGNLTAKIIITGSVDTLHVGTYTISYDVTDSAGNAAVTVKRTVNVTPDVTKPTVVLNGAANDTMVVYTSYSDPGATATDIVDGNRTSFIIKSSTLDTAHTGTYTITYTVSDSSGNIGFATRQVVVIDTTRPVITLTATSPLFWPVHVPYVDPGNTVTDNYDNGLMATVTGTVNENVVGTYYITFTAKDNSGNIANTVIREVRVQDTIKPVVSIIGPDVVSIDVFTSYFEFGSTAADNYDKVLPPVTVIGTVDTAVVADYTLKYVITDSSGNTADTVIRTVKVVDRVAPTITVHDPIIIERTQAKPNLADSVDYSDNYYPKSQLTLNISENINVNIDGYYYIDYTVTDPSGNTSQVAKGLLIVTRITGIMPAIVNDAAVNVYPNPAVNKAIVSLNFFRETEAKVSVYNMTGQKVLDVQPEGSFTNKLVELNLENLSAGTYFVRVEGNDGIVNKKLIISK